MQNDIKCVLHVFKFGLHSTEISLRVVFVRMRMRVHLYRWHKDFLDKHTGDHLHPIQWISKILKQWKWLILSHWKQMINISISRLIFEVELPNRFVLGEIWGSGWQNAVVDLFLQSELGMQFTGRLNFHSARHMLLLLHLSASGIPVAEACAEAANCTDKSLINKHKQHPPKTKLNRRTSPIIHHLYLQACSNQINDYFEHKSTPTTCEFQISLRFSPSNCRPVFNPLYKTQMLSNAYHRFSQLTFTHFVTRCLDGDTSCLSV